jgi:hypothetical protein
MNLKKLNQIDGAVIGDYEEYAAAVEAGAAESRVLERIGFIDGFLLTDGRFINGYLLRHLEENPLRGHAEIAAYLCDKNGNAAVVDMLNSGSIRFANPYEPVIEIRHKPTETQLVFIEMMNFGHGVTVDMNGVLTSFGEGTQGWDVVELIRAGYAG